MNPLLADRVRAWIALDPDEGDRATLEGLLDANDDAELERLFAAPLSFGTAGLRGPERPGPAGMNRATVRRATQGAVAWLEDTDVDLRRGVVVGRDARRGSERFNDEVVAVLLGAGATVYEMPGPLPTPFVPYCVKALRAAAGVMITASHNPPEDNGYKLYASDGAQITSPDDDLVERFSLLAGPATLATRSSTSHHVVSESLLEAYRSHVVARFAVTGGSGLRLTYTPLHGVGGESMATLLRDAGYSRVNLVAAQFEPDGSFPTLNFPNPEEPGALDLAMALANEEGATMILANDPDADRLAAAVRDGEGWRVLRGDEIGWLLASSLLEEIKARDEMVATTIVSSTLLEKMARDAEVPCATTLTGFKWIARSAASRVLGFGYEEALGYAVDPRVADKDGLSAALALARLAHELSLRGETLLDRLDEIEQRYGVHTTAQYSRRAESEEEGDQLGRALRQLCAAPPASLGSLAISEVVDLASGWRGLAPTDGVVLMLGVSGRVIVRPSGTEAKVKAYVEITPEREGSLHSQRARARELLEGVLASLATLLHVANS